MTSLQIGGRFSRWIICIAIFATGTVKGQTASVSFSPSFLRYQKSYLQEASTLDAYITVDTACPIGQFYVRSRSDDGSSIEWSQQLQQTNTTVAKIPSVDYSASGLYYVQCEPSIYYNPVPLPVSIPVAPEIIEVAAADSNDKSSCSVTTANASHVTYACNIFFDILTNAALLMITNGDGNCSSSHIPSCPSGSASLEVTGDTSILKKTTTQPVTFLPNYPNGNKTYYRLNATKWSEQNSKCNAVVNVRTAFDPTSLYHEAKVVLSLNHPAHFFKAVASSTSSTCEVACEIKLACPLSVTMTLEVVDGTNNNKTLVINEVAATKRVSISDIDSDTCEKLVTLAESKSGYAICTVVNGDNSEFTTTKAWSLDQVTGLVDLPVTNRDASLNWWEILLICLAILFLLIILIGIIFLICRNRDEKNDEKNKEAEIHYHVTPPDNTASTPASLPNYNPQPRTMSYRVEPLERPARVGSSFYDDNRFNSSYYGDFDTTQMEVPFSTPVIQQPETEYRAITVDNTPGSRNPILAGSIPVAEPSYYDNPAFSRSSNHQRSVRAEAIV